MLIFTMERLKKCWRKVLAVKRYLNQELIYYMDIIVPIKLRIVISYLYKHKEFLNLKSPQTFNEKINYLKLYDHNRLYTQLADKLKVREFVLSRVEDDICIPLIQVVDSFDDINFDDMPKSFVIKCNHDSGSVILCTDKDKIDIRTIRNQINDCLRHDYSVYGGEWCYHGIARKIMVEEYICDSNGKLNDYKFFTFDGKVEFIQVDYERFVNHKRNLYDREWQYIDVVVEYPTDKNTIIEKPNNLDEMIEIAEKLAEGLRFVRVDLYNVDGKVYFGELTFYHGSGMEKIEPKEYQYKWGKMIQIGDIY